MQHHATEKQGNHLSYSIYYHKIIARGMNDSNDSNMATIIKMQMETIQQKQQMLALAIA